MVDFCPDDTAELKAWRAEVRSFLEETLPGGMWFDFDYDEDDDRWAEYLAFWRRVGEKGWICPSWPKEYYGLGMGPMEKWILQEEFCAYGIPSYPVIGLNIGGAILRLGTPEQRRKHLKGIADATVLWGEGYSEPGAGSDLAALTTRAHLDGDHWVINGQKTLGTAAHKCQWMAVLARTDPESKGHAGISCFLAPLDSPGISFGALDNIAGGRQNHTFFDNVRVPADCMLGDLNQGWNQVWFGMGGERLDRAGSSPDPWQLRIIRMIDEVIDYCRQTRRNGVPMTDDPVVRLQLAELMMGVEIVKLQGYSTHSLYVNGGSTRGPVISNIHQAYHKEFWPHLAQVCMEIVGPLAQIQGGRWAQMHGRLEHYFRASFGNHAGGTSQLKRMVLATRGLGLPR